jgi:hypothetical protein
MMMTPEGMSTTVTRPDLEARRQALALAAPEGPKRICRLFRAHHRRQGRQGSARVSLPGGSYGTVGLAPVPTPPAEPCGLRHTVRETADPSGDLLDCQEGRAPGLPAFQRGFDSSSCPSGCLPRLLRCGGAAARGAGLHNQVSNRNVSTGTRPLCRGRRELGRERGPAHRQQARERVEKGSALARTGRS